MLYGFKAVANKFPISPTPYEPFEASEILSRVIPVSLMGRISQMSPVSLVSPISPMRPMSPVSPMCPMSLMSPMSSVCPLRRDP